MLWGNHATSAARNLNRLPCCLILYTIVLIPLMKRLFCCLLLLATPALAQNARPAGLLPPSFSGWERTGTPQVNKDAVQADPANAALLKEFGFDGYEAATY